MPHMSEPFHDMMMGGAMPPMPGGGNPYMAGAPHQMMTPLPQRLEFNKSTGEWVEIGNVARNGNDDHYDGGRQSGGSGDFPRPGGGNKNRGQNNRGPNTRDAGSGGGNKRGGNRRGGRNQTSVVNTEKIDAGAEQRTTLMIRNIPNR